MTGPDMDVDKRLIQETQLFTIGVGSIDPQARVAAGEITEQQIDNFIDALKSDEFYVDIDPAAVPHNCVDSRTLSLGPCAAGGTFSLVMGDALTVQRYRMPGETAPEHAVRYYSELIKVGQKIGGHDDEFAHGSSCGCGAQDRLDATEKNPASILKTIAEYGDELRTTASLLGVDVDDKLHDRVVSQAVSLSDEGYATTGAALREAYVEVAGLEAVETVKGKHKEVVVVVNKQSGKSINHPKLREVFGEDVNAFELDVASLATGCEVLSLSPEEALQQFVGALYYNLATTKVLAGPSLRVLVRD